MADSRHWNSCGALLAAMVLGCVAVNPCRAMTAEPQTFDVPRLEGIAVDGQTGDWGDGGLRIDALKPLGVDSKPVADFDARFRLAWNERGLLLLGFVRDDTWVESDDDSKLWSMDSLEIYLLPDIGGEDVVQWVIAPGMTAEPPAAARWKLHDHRKSSALQGLPAELQVAATRQDASNVVVEALAPWSALNIRPEQGNVAGCQILFNDSDGPGQKGVAVWPWYEGARTFRVTSNAHRLRLSDKPGPAERLYPTGRLVMARNVCRFYLTGPADLAGREVQVMNAGQVLTTGRLTADDYGRASGEVFVPLPPFGTSYGLLPVLAGGNYATRVGITSFEWKRLQSLYGLKIEFAEAVFSGTTFPQASVNAAAIEAIAGPFELETEFFDAGYKQVRAPIGPGRYGAVVHIRPRGGQALHRFATLYSLGVDGVTKEALLAGTIPGIASDVATQHLAEVRIALAARDRNAAITLAGLSAISASSPSAAWRTPVGRDDLWWAGLKQKTGYGSSVYKYLTYFPSGYDRDSSRRWPLFVYLHGAGLLGGSFDQFAHEGLPHCFRTGEMPFFVVAPHNPSGFWNADWIRDLMDEVCFTHRIDREAVYLLGHSYGAKGAFVFVEAYPQRLAAVVLMGAGANPRSTENFRTVPVWFINGEHEQPERIQSTRAATEAIRAAGFEANSTVIPGQGHGVEGHAMCMPELWGWLLGHRRSW